MENVEDFIATLDSDKTIEELEALIGMFEDEISSYIGIPVNPTCYTYMECDFDGRVILLDQFPCIGDLTVEINDNNIPLDDARIDYTAGIVYLDKEYKGFLKATYKYGLTLNQYESYVKPLILDMLDYDSDYGWNKNASSIKEGDVTVSFDTSVGTGALIQTKLNRLKNLFGVRVAMI